ncbi:uncharacterized protein LAJ45_07297 [Morchella importuna]|uniref:uncharacterized protein n=1 Tax=Morchella importuna TaxID=1174673 RepID=UPI001E8E8A26|nr:uncharacterized protein LAJ45_07297 [Morchella importuna]KAH8148586.1 hypothetical protein LAJ45_07297 [Morchella importuna]
MCGDPPRPPKRYQRAEYRWREEGVCNPEMQPASYRSLRSSSITPEMEELISWRASRRFGNYSKHALISKGHP